MEKVYIGRVLKIVIEIIFLNFSRKIKTFPNNSVFVLIINSSLSSLHPLRNNPSATRDITIQIHWGEVRFWFLIYKFKLVLKDT